MKYPFFTFLLAVVIAGCKPAEAPERIFVELPTSFKSYTHFQNGSYWIYQNDTNAADQDSAYVFNAVCNSNFNVAEVGFDYEYCSSELVNANGVWKISVFPFLTEEATGPFTFVFLEAKEGTVQDRTYHLFLDEAGNDTLQIEDEDIFIADRHPTFSLNGTTYSDVITVRHLESRHGNPTREISFAPNIGIIQRKQWDGTVWNLLIHSVVQ